MKELLHILDSSLIIENSTVIAAVSGGGDSMLLLYLLKKLKSSGEKNFNLVAAHFNHCIRENAARDEEFVKGFCIENDIKLESGRGNVPEYAEKEGISTETAARKMRYDFLAQTAKKFEDRYGSPILIATAHHMDDNAESILMNFIRGSGSGGLGGIKKKRVMSVNGIEFTLIRPLLDLSKSRIEKLNEEYGVAYVHDETNDIADTTRNKLRLEIIPLIKQLNPSYAKTFIRNAEIIKAEDEYLANLAEEKFLSVSREEKDVIYVDKTAMNNLPPVIRKRIIIKILSKLGMKIDYTYSDVERLDSLFEKSSGKMEFVGKIKAEADRSKVYFSNDLNKKFTLFEKISVKDIKNIKSIDTNSGRLEIEILDKNEVEKVKKLFKEKVRIDKNIGYTDIASLGEEIVIRNRACGDTFRPMGSPGGKNLGDIMTDVKMPLKKRDEVPIFESDGEIIFVPGIRIAQTAKVTDKTKGIVCFRYFE